MTKYLMAAPLPPLAERLAAELADDISKVREPYRTHLLAWLEETAGRKLDNLNSDLATWLNELGCTLMFDQYKLIRIVCQEAERYFGKRRNRR